MPDNHPYIPTLDGWRAVAILLVLAQHSVGSLGVNVPLLYKLGPHGVGIFFVLSGYLITTRLLEDECNLRRFYIRRAFRILPLVFLYVGILALLSHRIPVTAGELVSSILFARNYTLPAILASDGGGWFTLHFWSLALEEQFYLIWPSVLLVAGTRRARSIVLWGAAASAIWRLLCGPLAIWLYPMNRAWYMRPEFHCDGLLIGCALALYLRDSRIKDKIATASRLGLAFVLLWCVLVVITPDFPIILESIAAAGMITSTMFHPETPLGRLLETAPLKLIGRMSYSIYVWQELFLCRAGIPHALGKVQSFPWNLAAVFAVSWTSYRLFERPILKLGRRFAQATPRVSSAQVA